MSLEGTPYSLENGAAIALSERIGGLAGRIELLRTQGRLTEQTLRDYYGEKRFEQVAESNALEGSTLSVGETQLAVLKGTTLTGHDPAFVLDAQTLDRALSRLVDLAREKSPTDLTQVQEIQGLILGERPGAGLFRSEPVRISGSEHRPPATWQAVIDAMEAWESWSARNQDAPPLLRAALLHGWLVHIHPFRDGNGRTARAVTNLELVRAGYPPIIIRKIRDRKRYVDALQESDSGGHISPFLDLVLDRAEDSIRDLERAATKAQGYDPVTLRLTKAQQAQLGIWNAAVDLLVQLLRAELEPRIENLKGTLTLERFSESLSLDDFVGLCNLEPISRSWAFRVKLQVPGLKDVERLAWTGYRSEDMRKRLPSGAPSGPSLFWSTRNPVAFPPWILAHDSAAPGGGELTLVGDEWCVLQDRKVDRVSPSRTTERIAAALFAFLE